MARSPRDQLAVLLGELAGSGTFSVRRSSPVKDLKLEVRGVGQLQLPVPREQARQLRQLARPARYGLGERTLVDHRVRDTWEVPKSRLKIDRRRWNKTLLPMLDRLRADLGLPDGCRLKAELHSMLVYEPGQFFAPHQDSEKADDMVGTLVVMLPGASQGGSLVVEHAGDTATYRGSDTLLSFVAFYADCRHEVRPIKSGHRVVLTYNLMLAGEPRSAAATARLVPEAVRELAGHLSEHFTTTNRLVYLLDHEYTARGLSWARLKGSDAVRAAALRTAAGSLDCVTALALAEVQETWNCADPYWDGHRSSRWWDDDFDEDDELESDEYELDDLLDSSTTLDRWLDDSGAPATPIASSVGGDEVCASTPSAGLRPYSSEYEGYMGNYGNTMDRWYRRAAVVVWPRRLDFAVRAEASPRWAVESLAADLRAGEVAQARESAATLAPFWDSVVRASAPPGEGDGQVVELFTGGLNVASELSEPSLAVLLLRPFRLEMLAASHAPVLAGLGARYGASWVRELVAGWSAQGSPWTQARERPAWIASLDALCAALAATGDAGPVLARLILDNSWRWLADAVDSRHSLERPSSREQALSELAAPIAAVLIGAAAIGAADLREQVITSLRTAGDALLPCLIGVLRAVSDRQLGVDPLRRHCIQRLEARLRRPPRSPEDWSIDAPAGCGCPLCATLAGFLADPLRREFDWPLAQQGRRHVHERLDAHELPVRHQTRRVGRPYTLVLTKTPSLVEREAAARRQDETDLAWLREHLTQR